MKVGDLCIVEGVGLCVFLGEGIFEGWYRFCCLKTGQAAVSSGIFITPVKKCP